MKYCKRCLYPETKPDLSFEDGICSACLAFEARNNIDWKQREEQFKEIIKNIKAFGCEYDCIVPVSGGKDSHYQVIKCRELGLKVLAVTATTDDLSTIGRINLNNISKLGFDHIEINTNTKVRRKINAYTLRSVGDISWAEHVTIFTIPFREAMARNIPLVVWGENPQNEYGGPTKDTQDQSVLNNRWLQEFGGLNSLRVSDIISQGIATEQDMLQYTYPKNRPINVYSVWLGHYFPWDGLKNAEIAMANGFMTNPFPVEGCGYDYENLDNYQTGIHDYFKFLKFGFGRATDLVCNHIRRGNITRKEAKEMILWYDGQFPRTYLGKSLESILNRIGVTVDEFISICDSFTNKELFEIVKPFGAPPRPIAKFIEDFKNA